MDTEVQVILNIFRERYFQLSCKKKMEWIQNPCRDTSCSDLCAVLPSSICSKNDKYEENFISCKSTNENELDKLHKNFVRIYKCRCLPFDNNPQVRSLNNNSTCVCSTYKIKDAIVETRCELPHYVDILKLYEEYQCSVYDQLKQEELSLIKCEHKKKNKNLESMIVDPLCRPIVFHIQKNQMETNHQLNYTETNISENNTKINNENLQNQFKSILATTCTMQQLISFYTFFFLILLALGVIFKRYMNITYDTSSGRKRKRKQEATIRKALNKVSPMGIRKNTETKRKRTSSAHSVHNSNKKNTKLNLDILQKNKNLLHTSLF